MIIVNKYIEFLSKYKAALAKLVFEGPIPREHIAATLIAKQFDLATSIEILSKEEAITGIPILLRSIYEASNDLMVHLKNEDHMNNLYFKELKREKNSAEKARSAPEKSLLKTLFPSEESIQAAIDNYMKAELHGQKLGLNNRVTIKETFSELENETDYDSMYSFLRAGLKTCLYS